MTRYLAQKLIPISPADDSGVGFLHTRGPLAVFRDAAGREVFRSPNWWLSDGFRAVSVAIPAREADQDRVHDAATCDLFVNDMLGWHAVPLVPNPPD